MVVVAIDRLTAREWIAEFQSKLDELETDEEREAFMAMVAEMVIDHLQQTPKPGVGDADKERFHKSLEETRRNLDKLRRLREAE
jgi:hypothetical protein